jgi:prepilin-type N-terminal cleavage/methylation domain-containing protein
MKTIKRALKKQNGFTLIELLVAVGILAILAGVAVPVALKFTGTSQTKSALAELANVQVAVDSMLADQGLAALPDPGPGTSGALRAAVGAATDDMSLFPYTAAGAYALKGSGSGDYLRENTKGTYYVDTTGKVTQATTGY